MPRKSSTKTSPKTKMVRFDFYAPEAQRVSLAGNFNGWDVDALPMKKNESGTWKVSVKLAHGRYDYRFCVDGNWQEDPKVQERAENPFGGHNSIKTVN